MNLKAIVKPKTSCVLEGLYERGDFVAWKLSSPQDLGRLYIFFGSEKAAKKEGDRLFTSRGFHPRIRMLGSV